MSLEILTTIAAQQTADLQRVANQIGADIVPYIKLIESGIFKILSRYEDLNITMTRREKIISEITELTNLEYSEYNKHFDAQMRLVSEQEVATGVMALNTAIESDVEISKPLKSAVSTAVIATPIQQGDKSWTTYKGAQGAFKSQFVSEIDSAVLVAIQGATTGKEVADAIYTQIHYTGRKASKSVLDRSRRNANSLAATLTNHTANVTRVQFGEANKKLIKGYVFVAVIDSQTSQTCRAGDQTTMQADDPRFAAWIPPRHRNALLKGSMITTERGQVSIEDVAVGDKVLTHNGNYKEVYTVMCKPNDRLVRKVVFSNGSILHSTDEHPILTKDNGWINISDLNVGDQVFYSGHNIAKPNYGGGPKVDHRILSDAHNLVTEVADELISYGIFSNSRGVSSAINLNNNVTDNKVSDVLSNRDLKLKFYSKVSKVIDKNLLVLGRGLSVVLGAGSSYLLKNSFHLGRVSRLHSIGRRFAAGFMHIWHPVRPVVNTFCARIKLAAINNRLHPSLGTNAELDTPLSNGVVAHPVFSLYSPKAFSKAKMLFLDKLSNLFITSDSHNKPLDCISLVTATEIVEYHYNGYVYNLAVKDDETYVANGIVVHNCRSAITYDVDDKYKLDESDSKRQQSFTVDGYRDPKQVSSKGIYYDKMLTLSAADQDYIMGPTLGKAFRAGIKDGTLTPESFAKLTVDNLYQPLTIAQLSEKNNRLGEILRKQAKNG